MSHAATPPRSRLLPELRQELRLFRGPQSGTEQAWLLYDPVRHRYYQISRRAFELLERWRPEPADALAKRSGSELERPVSADEVNELAHFIVANNLALAPPNDDPLALAGQEAGSRHAWAWRIVHSYLFFKVPLVRPARFLAATMPLVAPLFSRTAAIALAIISCIGLYFASRQWDLFVATFLDFLTLEGFLVYGASLIVIKALHELGHAYAATRVGVRVNTMGIAFMVLTPILYTDVTDAWRLRNRRDKLAIDAAGIVVELGLAGIALFLWAFLPEGPMRSAAFVTATTSLAMGLAVNLNPLMRFDGYYLLADAWQVPNLQSRSNALAVWWLRERLFALGHQPPESVPARRRRLLVAYAIAMWIYRLFLFVGIALVVYHMFFKALGIILFAVEIIWFILLPIGREISKWWSMRPEIVATRRSILTAAIATLLVAALVVPWSGTVKIQAVAYADHETRLYAPRPARIVAVNMKDEGQINADEALVILEAPDLDHELAQTRRQIELVRHRLDRIAGDAADRSNRIVLEGELVRHQTNLAGLEAERQRLTVRAPYPGTARDVDRDLKPGEWIDDATPLGRVIGFSATETSGYVGEDDLWRLSIGADVTFIPEAPQMAKRHGKVIDVVATGTKAIDLAYLASVYGGAVPSDRGPDNEIRPRSGRHLVRVKLDGPPMSRVVRGTLHISGKRESIAAAMWRRILQVLVRETSA